MQAAIIPHNLPETGTVHKECSEVFIDNFKDFAGIFFQQPVVRWQERKVLMSHHRQTVAVSSKALYFTNPLCYALHHPWLVMLAFLTL